MKLIDCDYRLKEDISLILEADKMNFSDFSKASNISRMTLNEIIKNGKSGYEVCEKIYSYIYRKGIRLNKIKEELLKENGGVFLYHGSKFGLESVSFDGSRNNCDFGNGFYLGESYTNALSFVCENEKSSVYSFRCDFSGLKTKKFECVLDWMLAICYFRGTLKSYESNERIIKLIRDLKDIDVIIAPIADNKMFHIMTQFVEGDINADVAVRSLSAASLGFQYVIKSERALNRLVPVEKYYICKQEREDCVKGMRERAYEIDTKLMLSKRQFKDGLFIEEILK